MKDRLDRQVLPGRTAGTTGSSRTAGTARAEALGVRIRCWYAVTLIAVHLQLPMNITSPMLLDGEVAVTALTV